MNRTQYIYIYPEDRLYRNTKCCLTLSKAKYTIFFHLIEVKDRCKESYTNGRHKLSPSGLLRHSEPEGNVRALGDFCSFSTENKQLSDLEPGKKESLLLSFELLCCSNFTLRRGGGHLAVFRCYRQHCRQPHVPTRYGHQTVFKKNRKREKRRYSTSITV